MTKEQTIAELISVMESARDDGERNCQDLVRIHVGHIRATIDVLKQLQSSHEPTREPLPTCAERVSDLRLTEIQRSFIMALDKGDPNYMVSLEWNEGLSILNELKFKRVTENRGAPR